jgi:hypothetical protein
MSAVYPPNQTTTIMVSTLVSSKIIYLPSISTIQPGKFFCIKDINGNAFRSSIYISTTGVDTIEYLFRPSSLYALLSTNNGAVVLMPDTMTNWAVLQQYTTNAI